MFIAVLMDFLKLLYKLWVLYSHRLPYLAQYAPRWERYTLESPTYASLESSQVNEGYQQHQVAFWNQLMPEVYVLDKSNQGRTTTSTFRPSTGEPTIEPQS